MQTENPQGVVFNIQHFSIHDGPGIRTTVFLKGCPLRCVWCQNPESHDFKPVLFFDAEKCTGCGACAASCPEGAVRIFEGKSATDRRRCQGAGQCAETCPNAARSLVGRCMRADEVFEDVNADFIFYQNSGGGVTLSGGEPIAQPEFSIAILKRCRRAGIHTAIETCGAARWETLRAVLEHTDLVLYDIKHLDPARHKQHTSVSNRRILGNARKIRRELKLPMHARVPLIPGHNDSAENLDATARFIAHELGNEVHVHLLPFHRFGETKLERMEKPEDGVSIEPPDEDRIVEVKKIFESSGLTVIIGG